MEHQRAVTIPDITRDERIPQDAYRPTFVKSLAMVPVGQGEPVAALGAYWASLHDATAAEVELLQTVANAAALATALVQLQAHETAGRKLQRFVSALSDRLQDFSAARVEQRRAAPLNWTELGKAVLLGIGFATGSYVLRLALSPLLGSEVPFVVFFLGVAAAVVWGGARAGLTAALVGGLLGHWAFIQPAGEFLFTGPKAWGLLTFWALTAVFVYLIHRLLVAQASERVLNEKLQLIGQELQHRFKNFIAVTQALAIQTSRTSNSHADFRVKFSGRLNALGSAQSLLKDAADTFVPLTDLVRKSIEPFREGDHFAVGSLPDVLVPQDVATGVALVLNELATNALKHGSLSVPEGRVVIHGETAENRAKLTWEELGGPPTLPPQQHSFGMRLIRAAIPKESGSAEIDFRPEGLACHMVFISDAAT
jgi:two-component sensor histidine kinase